MSLLGIYGILKKAQESFTKALSVMDQDHAYIHQQLRYTAFYKATIAGSGTLQISLQTPAVASGKEIHYRGLAPSPSGELLDIQIFEDATIDAGGTAITPVNRFRPGTPPASTVELKYGTTFTDNGTELTGLREFFPGASGGGPVSSSGGEKASANEEVVLKSDTVYRILITNGDTDPNIVGLLFNWYEEEAR